MLTIRLACPADAEVLVHLNAAFNEVEDVTPEDVRRSLLSSPEIVVVAEVDAEIAAFCCAQVHHSFCYQAPVAEVTEMYVDEAYCRQGCASEMLAFLEKHLQSRWGVDEIHLLTGTTNFAAQSAYKKAGFRVRNEAYMTKDVVRNR